MFGVSKQLFFNIEIENVPVEIYLFAKTALKFDNNLNFPLTLNFLSSVSTKKVSLNP